MNQPKACQVSHFHSILFRYLSYMRVVTSPNAAAHYRPPPLHPHRPPPSPSRGGKRTSPISPRVQAVRRFAEPQQAVSPVLTVARLSYASPSGSIGRGLPSDPAAAEGGDETIRVPVEREHAFSMVTVRAMQLAFQKRTRELDAQVRALDAQVSELTEAKASVEAETDAAKVRATMAEERATRAEARAEAAERMAEIEAAAAKMAEARALAAEPRAAAAEKEAQELRDEKEVAATQRRVLGRLFRSEKGDDSYEQGDAPRRPQRIPVDPGAPGGGRVRRKGFL